MYQRCVKKLLFRYTHKKLKLVKLDSVIASKKKTPRKRNRKQNYPLRSYRRSHLTARLSGNLTSKLHEGEQLIFDPHTPRSQVGMRDPWKRGGESSGEQRCGRKESRGDGTSECSTGVHVPTTYPAYLSLRCARDILISSTLYIYISLSFSLLPLPPPPLSPPPCVVSVYLLPSVYASIPFDPFFFLFIARSSLSLFIYALPRYVIRPFVRLY